MTDAPIAEQKLSTLRKALTLLTYRTNAEKDRDWALAELAELAALDAPPQPDLAEIGMEELREAQTPYHASREAMLAAYAAMLKRDPKVRELISCLRLALDQDVASDDWLPRSRAALSALEE